MVLEKLSISEFAKFASSHPLGNYFQSANYVNFLKEQNIEYDIVGLLDNNEIKAAALIVIKKINLFNKYAYSPKGFLIDYNNTLLLKELTNQLKIYLNKNKINYLTINPEIEIAEIDYKSKITKYNNNQIIESYLSGLNYQKRTSNNFSTFNAIQVLKNININNFEKNTKNKIKKALNTGMKLVKVTKEQLKVIYNFIKNKEKLPIDYYEKIYDSYNKNNSIDLFLVEINYEDYLIYLRDRFDKELAINNELSNKKSKSKQKLKKNSDKLLQSIKENISKTTNLLTQTRKEYIAGAIIIKYQNRVHIFSSGYNKKYKQLVPNYFLYYKLMDYYKNNYDYMDLNGLSNHFNEDNKPKGINTFKLSFNPMVFEYIGEYDLINK